MAFPGEGILTDLAKRLEDKTIKEFKYFLDFEDHVQYFVIEHNSLVAKRNKVLNEIEAAKKRNENQIEDDVQNWIEEVDSVIRKNTKIKQTWSYGWCPYWKYRQGKRLAKRTLAIRDHIQRGDFDIVARPAELPGIEYHASSRDFIDFGSRKSKFNDLLEALVDGNHHMIGLQGMGGTGKTTLATQVGKQLEESKAFEKVIFVIVSNPPDVNKIRGDIARQLGLDLKQREEAEHSKFLWSRISNNEKKLLIILDDVWGKLNLSEIGIPFGLDHKDCYVLITTRNSKVCEAMSCQQIVHLQTLKDEDALQLFLFHARSDDANCTSNDLEGLARDFVKECRGLPIAIVALASTLRSWPRGEWNAALTTLRNSKPFVDVDEDLVEVYKCLRLSYDHLKDEKAQQLLLLCSIFPEDYEFHISLVIRLITGSGIFGDVDKYFATRSQALALKNKLIASSLLLKVEEKECVKMHDLVREVAQWIGKEDIQVIKGSTPTSKANKRFVFWSADDFPDQFDGAKLEILLLWISGNVPVKDPNAFFEGMTRLKILFLLGEHVRKVPLTLSLSKSLLSLENIRSLILDGWELGDISILKNLQSLVTFELKNCLIIELPKDIKELKKLRLLGLIKCEIQKNNPFDVIERCSQLEELYFVENYNVRDWKPEDGNEIEDEGACHISLALQMFSVACDGFQRFANDDNGLLKCFNPEHIKHLISEAMFKYLVRNAQVLELGKLGQTGWKNLIPDIISIEDGGTNNLMKLYLCEWVDIEYLVDSSKYHPSNKEVFSKLVELHLYGVNVQRLYRGAMPSNFLRQLQILKLKSCMKLQSIFLVENMKLPYLKVLELKDCPMFQPSIFQPSVARSLVQLEELAIEGCRELKTLILHQSWEEEMKVVDAQQNFDILFPELKSLKIRECGKLGMVLSFLLPGDLPKLKGLDIDNCVELKYIFGEYRDVGPIFQQNVMLPSVIEAQLAEVPSLINIFKKCNSRQPQVSKEESTEKKSENSKTSALSWPLRCCSKAPTTATLENHAISQESCATSSNQMIEILHTAECLMRQPFSLLNITDMRLAKCSEVKSLFNVSIAKTIMLEKLEISTCENLKQIVTNDAEDDNHLNSTSIFPKLHRLEVSYCNKLEFIFPSTLSGALPKLKFIFIDGAPELKYGFGKYIDLPAMISLWLRDVPISTMIGTGLETLKTPKESFCEASSNKRIEIFYTAECLIRQSLSLLNIRVMTLKGCSKVKSLFGVSITTTIMLELLEIDRCEELKQLTTNDGEDENHLNCISIFPKLQELTIFNCNKLEFIFPSTLSGALPKLKSIKINEASELKYGFGKSIDLPALEFLTLSHVNVIGIGLETLEAPKESSCEASSNKRIETFYTAECLMRHPLSLRNMRDMLLMKCSKLKSLFSVSIATTIMLEKLHIRECEELKQIITNDGEDDDHLNGTSIFSKLQEFKIYNCNKLEFIFPSTLSGALLKLKSISINGAHELKYGFGKYIQLPAMESLSLDGVSAMTGIGLETLEVPKDIKSHVLNETSEGAKESEIQEIVNLQTPLTPRVGFHYVLNFHSLKEITIYTNKKLKALFSVSACKHLPQLSKLDISHCEELVNVVEDDHHHMNYSSFFPKLESLTIRNCNKLEFIFPLSFFGALQKLKSLGMRGAAELKYIFGKYDEDGDYLSNENESDVLHIHLPALESLTIIGVPKMINNICAKKYHLSFPPLKSIELGCLQEFSFLDLMAYIQGIQLNMKAPKDLMMKMIKDVQKLTWLTLRDSNIEEVLNLEGVQIEGLVMTLSLERMWLGNLSELRHIWKGPKYILRLPNLRMLSIITCKKLKAIFNVSIVRSLPHLDYLRIEDCDELVDIIEEEIDEDHLHHQLCFPKLRRIEIKRCHSLKFLFSISTCGVFPELYHLEIEESCELEQVFVHKQDDMQKMTTLGQAFPKLSYAILRKLPKLINICEGIDFPVLNVCSVYDCPKYQELTQIGEWLENVDSESQTSASQDFAESSKEAMKESVEEVESSMSKEHTVKEIEANDDPTPALENPALKCSTSLCVASKKETHEQSFQEDDAIEEARKAIQSTDSESRKQTRGSFTIAQDLTKVESTRKTTMTDQQGPEENMTNIADGFVEYTAVVKTQMSITENIPEDTTPMIAKTNTCSIHSYAQDSVSNPPAQVASVKVTHEQDSQEDDATGNVTIGIQSTDRESKKKTGLSPIITQGVENIQKQTTTMEARTDTSSFYSHVEGSQLGPYTMSVNDQSFNGQHLIDQCSLEEAKDSTEETVKQDFQKPDSSNQDDATISTTLELVKQPIGLLDMPSSDEELAQPIGLLDMPSNDEEFAQTTKEIRDTNVPAGPKSKKTEVANLLTNSCDFNTSLPDVIPSSHLQSQTSVAGSSSPILEIGEIFQLVELKEGEAALLAKALELYPQLRLSRGQRTHPIIAFSYRVIVDILVMLETKTPYTITTSDRTTLEANLGAATFLGFDKDWIESVQAKVFGIDKSDVMVAEEKISSMEEELEKCDIALESMRKKRMEAKEKLAIMQNEFEAIDTQLFDLLEDRKNLVKKIVEFKKIVSAKDRPFGI